MKLQARHLSISCPFCGAPRGSRCVTKACTKLVHPHIVRVMEEHQQRAVIEAK